MKKVNILPNILFIALGVCMILFHYNLVAIIIGAFPDEGRGIFDKPIYGFIRFAGLILWILITLYSVNVLIKKISKKK